MRRPSESGLQGLRERMRIWKLLELLHHLGVELLGITTAACTESTAQGIVVCVADCTRLHRHQGGLRLGLVLGQIDLHQDGVVGLQQRDGRLDRRAAKLPSRCR